MVLSRNTVIKSLILVALTATLVYGFSFRPPTGFAGCFGEANCTECHSDNPIDTGGGMFTLTSPPLEFSPTGENLFSEGYVPNHPYTLVVTLAQSGQRRWGFELISRFNANMEQAGDFTAGADGFTFVQVFALRGWQYIGHNGAGTFSGTVDGPVRWVFQWRAPPLSAIPPADRRITFCGVGNAADNDFGTGGDFIYSLSRTINPLPGTIPASDEENGTVVNVLPEGGE